MMRRALSGMGGAVVADTSTGDVALCDRCFHLLTADSGPAAFHSPGAACSFLAIVNIVRDRLW